MTPDELITRVHRQRSELIADELALDALMSILPRELQDSWLQALRSLAAKRRELLQKHGTQPLALEQQDHAIARKLARLQQAREDSTF